MPAPRSIGGEDGDAKATPARQVNAERRVTPGRTRRRGSCLTYSSKAAGYRPPAPLPSSPWDRPNPVSQPLAVM
jgi:hypothetical protein